MEREKNVKIYKELFQMITNGRKTFGYRELGHMMKSFYRKSSSSLLQHHQHQQQQINDLELQNLINQIDMINNNLSGEIEFDEFQQYLLENFEQKFSKQKQQEMEDELYESLKLFDIQNGQIISLKDFRYSLMNLGECFTADIVDEMFNELNLNENNDEIFLDELIGKLLQKK